MANNTPEFWSIDGVSLHQYGWSVTTVGGARYDVPPKRGENITLGYRPGQVHRPKLLDQRVISLVMFLVGWDPATGNVNVPDQRLQWNDSWDFLRRLVYKHQYQTGGRVTLTRRWFLTPVTIPTSGSPLQQGDPGVPTPGARLVTAQALAELSSDMAPSMTGRFRSDFQIDLTLADPYFYGTPVTATLSPGQTQNVWNDGHDLAWHAYMYIDLKGPLVKPIVRNLSTSPMTYFVYNGTINAGQTIRVTPGQYTALQTTANNANRIGYISHAGARQFMLLLPGHNQLRLDATSGSGTAEVVWRPPYI